MIHLISAVLVKSLSAKSCTFAWYMSTPSQTSLPSDAKLDDWLSRTTCIARIDRGLFEPHSVAINGKVHLVSTSPASSRGILQTKMRQIH